MLKNKKLYKIISELKVKFTKNTLFYKKFSNTKSREFFLNTAFALTGLGTSYAMIQPIMKKKKWFKIRELHEFYVDITEHTLQDYVDNQAWLLSYEHIETIFHTQSLEHIQLMIGALAECIKSGNYRGDLKSVLYLIENYPEKIASSMMDKILFNAIIEALNTDILSINILEIINNVGTAYERKTLVKYLIKQTQEGMYYKNLLEIYANMNDPRDKKEIFPLLYSAMQTNEYNEDHWVGVYEHSCFQEKNIIFNYLLSRFSEIPLGKIIQIYAQLDYGDRFSTHQPKLFSYLFSRINDDLTYEDYHDLGIMYVFSNHEQQALLFPYLSESIEMLNNESMAALYGRSSFEIKNILFPLLLSRVTFECSYHFLIEFYIASGKEQQDELFPYILHHVEHGFHNASETSLLMEYEQLSDEYNQFIFPIQLCRHNDYNKIDGFQCLSILYSTSLNEVNKEKLLSIILEKNNFFTDEQYNYYYQFYLEEPQFAFLINESIQCNKQPLLRKNEYGFLTHLMSRGSKKHPHDYLNLLKKTYHDLQSAFIEKHQNPIIKNWIVSSQGNLAFIYATSTHDVREKLLKIALTENIPTAELIGLYSVLTIQHAKKHRNYFYSKLSDSLGVDAEKLLKTQTGNHLMNHRNDIFSTREFLSFIDSNPDIKKMIKQVINQEFELINQGYAVFYNAQLWQLYWLEIVYTLLWEIKNDQPLTDYLFMRFTDNRNDAHSIPFMEEQKLVFEQLIENGCFDNHRSSLVFLNYALFANQQSYGSSSFTLFRANKNYLVPPISSRDIFEKFGLDAFYEEHAETIEDLYHQFLSLSETGNLLQIAFKYEDLKQHVYLGKSGGFKNTAILAQNRFFNYTKETQERDVEVLINTLIQKPKQLVDLDLKEFVFVANDFTVNKLINVIKIMPFNTADEHELNKIKSHLTDFLKENLHDKKSHSHSIRNT